MEKSPTGLPPSKNPSDAPALRLSNGNRSAPRLSNGIQVSHACVVYSQRTTKPRHQPVDPLRARFVRVIVASDNFSWSLQRLEWIAGKLILLARIKMCFLSVPDLLCFWSKLQAPNYWVVQKGSIRHKTNVLRIPSLSHSRSQGLM